jgi:hypothetical protein
MASKITTTLSIKTENLSNYDSTNPEEIPPISKSVQPLDRKRNHKSISDYSEKQNEKIFTFLTPLSGESNKRSFFPDIHLKAQVFTDRDYANLMNSINEVISPKGASDSITLTEGDHIEVHIGEGKLKFFRCPVKGKKAPLTIKIKRKQGRVCSYTSSEVQEPGPLSYEKCFPGDYLEIRESSLHFKYDTLYLGIKGIEESLIKLYISFGNKIGSLEELKRIKRQLTLLPTQFTEGDESKELDKSPSKFNHKDFIQENKCTQYASLTSRASLLSEKAEIWKIRREKVLTRKKDFLDLKKNKALENLNKKKLKEEQEKVKRKELRIFQMKEKFWGFWLKYSYFAFSIECIRSSIFKRKKEKIQAQTLLRKVILIQKAYKSFKNNQNIQDIIMCRCKNSLMFYSKITKNITKKHSGSNLTSFISFAANAFRAFNKFSTFFRNTIRIQRNIRMHLSRKEQLIQELKRMWTSACEHYLFRKSSGKKQSRKRASLKVISIPTHVREAAIEEYYMKCVERYKRDTKIMFENLKDNDKRKLFHTALSGFLQKSLMFQDYLPTRRQLEKIIEGVVKKMETSESKQ